MNLSRVLCSGVVAAMLWGCSPTPDVKEVAQESSDRAASIVKGAVRSTRTLENHEGLKTFSAGIQALNGAFSGMPASGATAPDFRTPVMDATTQAETERQVDAMAQILRDRIFVQKNVESSGGGEVIFRLKGETMCADQTGAARQACVFQVDAIEPRIRVTKDGDDLQLDFMLGRDKVQPFSLVIGTQRLALTTDLATLKSLYLMAGRATTGLPDVFEGKIEISLTRNAEDDFTLAAGFVTALRFGMNTPEGHRVEFSSAARTKFASYRIEGAAKRLTSEVDLGETRFVWPATSLNPSLAGSFTLDAPGVSYAFIAEPGQTDVHIANVGLGNAQTTWTLNGAKLVGVDLNPGAGRRVEVRLAPAADGNVTLHFAPQLDVISRFNLAPIDTFISSPAYLMDNEYRWNLSGPAGVSLTPVAATASTSGGLKIVSGRLVLESLRGSPGSLTVEAGQCLMSKTLDGTDHPLLSYLQTQACP